MRISDWSSDVCSSDLRSERKDPPMLNDTDQAPDTASRLIDAARSIATQLDDDKTVRRGLINEAMTAAFGAKSADGAWTQRDSFVMTEISALLPARSAEQNGRAQGRESGGQYG